MTLERVTYKNSDGDIATRGMTDRNGFVAKIRESTGMGDEWVQACDSQPKLDKEDY